jgi:hypothetical protein
LPIFIFTHQFLICFILYLKSVYDIMKKAFVLIIFIFSSLSLVTAQDIITLKSGDELKARIVRLNPKDVVFIPQNNSDTITLLRDEITMLHYQSGINIYLTENNSPALVANNSEPGNDSLFSLGARDAGIYYTGYKAAATGTLITSFFIPWGLVPAIACSATPPSTHNLGYRNPKLMENPSYYAGYTDQAFKIKKKKVWTNFGIGTGAMIAFYIIAFAISNSYY